MTMEENSIVNEWQPTETVIRSFQSFRDRLKQMLPNEFTDIPENIRMDVHEGGASVIIPLTRNAMMDSLLTLLEEKMDFNILYAFRKDKGQYYEAMGYSTPYNGNMIIIMLASHQHSVVTQMEVLLYDSYEPMFCQVRESLSSLHEKGAEKILEEERIETLYAHFFK